MSYTNLPISNEKIKQFFLLLIILVMILLISFNLALFIPSVLGAITLYIITRKYNLYLQEKKNWKPWLAVSFIMLISIFILVLPVYLTADLVIQRLGDAKEYMGKFNVFIDKIYGFVYEKTNIDILSQENMTKLKNTVGEISSSALSTTFNTITVVASTYFILYFMMEKPRLFERLLKNAAPLKKANIDLIGEKIRAMVTANAIGIPVVAVGQGIVALIGYYIFDAPNPLILFALTSITAMIPIVGSAIIFVPVCVFMIAENNFGGGLGLFAYCVVLVGLTDNLIRFTLLKRLEDIHPLNTVFGIIMGMNLFGFMGLIFGPILISITILLIQVYKDEFNNNERELIAPEQPLE